TRDMVGARTRSRAASAASYIGSAAAIEPSAERRAPLVPSPLPPRVSRSRRVAEEWSRPTTCRIMSSFI
ncbi:MAG: hypothetical protein ACM3YM_05305, partial [Sphingomonadales bacterium]